MTVCQNQSIYCTSLTQSYLISNETNQVRTVGQSQLVKHVNQNDTFHFEKTLKYFHTFKHNDYVSMIKNTNEQ